MIECETKFLWWFVAKKLIFASFLGTQKALESWVTNIEKQTLPIQIMLGNIVYSLVNNGYGCSSTKDFKTWTKT